MKGFTESTVNRSKNRMIGEYTDSVKGTVFADCETLTDFYREVMRLREYGRCAGKVYVDQKGGPKHIGYVFEKLARYEDTRETYLHETWLSFGEFVPAQSAHVV